LFLIDDVEAIEAAESQIDQFISKRAREKADADKGGGAVALLGAPAPRTPSRT
jgi:hypothetical protein